MTIKRLVTASLLVFVAGSLAYMVARDTLLADVTATNPDPGPAQLDQSRSDIVVYYFDSDKQCTTCDNLKSYTLEALQTYFPSQVESGEITWRVVDVDEPGNEHYVTEFGLYSKAVVLVHFDDGEQTRWKNLESVWELVYDKPAYLKYIRDEIEEFAGDGS
ncbi:MAG: hypothetical protein KJ052_14200 [Candidatus Hydrogenedentes bacterium]|nr:hypothetical protein [Candidatus Hydrogenedentota bacterium]